MTPTAELQPSPPAGPIGVPKRLIAGRACVALSAPLAIGALYGVGWVILHSYNIPYQRELLAAAGVSLIAGLLAVLPMVVLMARGAIAIVHLTMIATLLRLVLTLVGLALLFGPGWKLDHSTLVLFTVGFYLALMTAESAATIWASRH